MEILGTKTWTPWVTTSGDMISQIWIPAIWVAILEIWKPISGDPSTQVCIYYYPHIEIWTSQVGDHECYFLLECDAVYFGGQVPQFRYSLLLPGSYFYYPNCGDSRIPSEHVNLYTLFTAWRPRNKYAYLLLFAPSFALSSLHNQHAR